MKKLSTLAAAIVAGTVGLSAAVQAAPLNTNSPNVFSYTYIEADYINMDDFGDGLRLKGSFDIDKNLAIMGAVDFASEHGVDWRRISVGLGYHQKIANKTDILVHGEVENISLDWDSGYKHDWDDHYDRYNDDSDTGVRVGAEIRHALTSKVELFGDVSVTTAYDTDVPVTLGGRFSFTRQLQATASFEFSDEDTFALGLRYYFR